MDALSQDSSEEVREAVCSVPSRDDDDHIITLCKLIIFARFICFLRAVRDFFEKTGGGKSARKTNRGSFCERNNEIHIIDIVREREKEKEI